MNGEERVIAAGSKRAPRLNLSAYAPELPRFASSVPADALKSQAGGIRTALLAPKTPRRGKKKEPGDDSAGSQSEELLGRLPRCTCRFWGTEKEVEMKAGWAGAARFSCKPTGKGSQNQAPGGTRLGTTRRSKGWEKTQTLSPRRAPSCKALAKEADPHGHGWCTEHPELSFILPLPAGFRHSTAFPGRATPWGCNDPSGLPFQPQKEDFVTAHSIRGAPHRSQPPPRTQFNIFHLLNPARRAQPPAGEGPTASQGAPQGFGDHPFVPRMLLTPPRSTADFAPRLQAGMEQGC